MHFSAGHSHFFAGHSHFLPGIRIFCWAFAFFAGHSLFFAWHWHCREATVALGLLKLSSALLQTECVVTPMLV